MSAYGLVFIVLAIISYVIFHFMFANQALAPTYCNAAPSFSCVAFALNRDRLVHRAALAGYRRHHNNKRRSLFGFGQRHRRLAAVPGNINLCQIHRGSAVHPVNSNLQTPLTLYSSSQVAFSANCFGANGYAKGLSGHHDDRLPLAELHLLQPAKHHEHDTADHTILRQVQLNAQVRAEGPQGRPTKTKLMYALKL